VSGLPIVSQGAPIAPVPVESDPEVDT